MGSYFTTAGDVRGDCGHKHKTAPAAEACRTADMRAVKAGHGQSAYSDRDVYEVENDGEHVWVIDHAGNRAMEAGQRARRLIFG